MTIGFIVIAFCKDIHGFQKIKPAGFGDPLTFPLATAIGWIARKFGADIPGLQRVETNGFGDFLTLHLVGAEGEREYIVWDKI